MSEQQALALGARALHRVLHDPGGPLERERLKVGDDRRRRDVARLELVAELEPVGVLGRRRQLGQRGVVGPRGLFVTSLCIEGPAELEPELGPSPGIRRRRHRLGEVVGGCDPAERGLGGSELGEHLGTDLGARRLGERSLEVPDRGLSGAGLARGGAQLLDDPLVPAGVAEQQVSGDPLDVSTLGVHQPSGVEVAARALEQRDVLFDRVLHQRMDEPKWLAGEHDVDARERVRGRRGVVDRERRQRRRSSQRDVVAEDCDRPGQRRRRRAEPSNPDAE